MYEFNSNLVQKDRLLPGIHGLRGVAALAVALFHLIYIGGIQPPTVFGFIGRDFGNSVHLFFILSAYSLMYSTESKVNQPNWLPDYFIKRFFRIAPLFYLMMALFLVQGLFSATGLKNITSIILNLTFTFGFVPSSGFVWGGWSVGIEMLFYVIFPVLLLLIKSHRAALTFLIFSIVVSCALRSALHFEFVGLDSSAKYDWSYFSFASNICFFAMGMYGYLLSKFYKSSTKLISIYVPIIAVVIIGTLLFSDLGAFLYNTSRFDIVLWGLGLTALCVWQGANPSRIIANGLLEHLGERSFSIYLLHPVVIYAFKAYLVKVYEFLKPFIGLSAFFISAIFLIALILIFAEFTYRFIEVPGINFGKKLIKQRKLA
jgi:peptidoglycan/LPS O-acetylase OafA/YrhL